MEFSFCETVTATGRTPWHIRKLTDNGHKYGGGADTLALCERKVAWDVDVQITEHHLAHSCEACVERYRKDAMPEPL